MEESEGIQAMVNQIAIQAAIVMQRDADEGPISAANAASLSEPPRQRHGRPALEKPSFNLNTQDRHIELLDFKIEVMNNLKKYELTDE